MLLSRNAAFQLRDRCHVLLIALRDAAVDMGSDKMNDALVETTKYVHHQF